MNASTGSYASSVRPAVTSTWWHSPVNAAASAPSAVARGTSSPASKIRMSLPQSLSTLVHARQPQLPSRERLRSIQRSPPRDTRPGSCRKRLPGATLRPLHEYPPLRAAFPRPFRLQSPPSHPQPAHRTPLTTSHERSFNQSYFATIPFRAVIRPIRASQSVAGIEHALAETGTDPTRNAAAVSMLLNNTATKMFFRTTDEETMRRIGLNARRVRCLRCMVDHLELLSDLVYVVN